MKCAQFLLRVTHHCLVDMIGGQKAAVQVTQRNADSRIRKDGSPPSSLFRRASSARFRSSISVFVPYHLATFPDRSRRGLPRKRNQRNSPSKRRKRPSTSNGFTEFKASRKVSRIRGRSSG